MLGRHEGVWEWDQYFYLQWDLQRGQPGVTQYGWTGCEAPEGKICTQLTFLSPFKCWPFSHVVLQCVLQGLDVHLRHMSPLLTETMVLPSLSGLPLELALNLTSMFSLCLNGKLNYRDPFPYFLNGYIKPRFKLMFFYAIVLWNSFHSHHHFLTSEWQDFLGFSIYSSLSATVGVHSVLGQAAVQWIAELKSSTSLDGSIQMEDGGNIRVVLNTPEDSMDIISLRYTAPQKHL